MNIRAQVYGYTPSAESPLVLVKNPKGVQRDMLHSIPVERRESRCGDTRLQERDRAAIQPARVVHKRKTYDVQLMNLCAGGAMVTAAFEAMPWESAQLYLRDQGMIDCSVLWVKNGFMGLQFAEELSQASAGWEDQWQRMSLNEPGEDAEPSNGH